MLAVLCWPLLSAAAPAPQQLHLSAQQISRAGIATASALSALAADAPPAGNDQYLSGTVVTPPGASALVSAMPGGVVQDVHVATLQQVRSGTPLLTLFSQPWLEWQRDYLEKSSAAKLAAARQARDEGLYSDGIIARARLEESRDAAQLAALAAREREQALRSAGLDGTALRRLRDSHAPSPLLTVRASQAGTVLELPVQPGQRVEAGALLARTAASGPLWVQLQASRTQLPLLRVGDLLQVEGCAKLRVTAISPVVDSATQSAQLRAQQVGQDPCLKVNAFVEARLLRAAPPSDSVAVPAAALVQRMGEARQDYVFVANAHGYAAVPVQATPAGGGMVWVRGALAVGDAVAVRGLAALKGSWSGLGPASLSASQGGK
ncbi:MULTISPECIES: efflux RND transporter periplasmic adaptor subunit [unclassified Janthinobacterium]|uniref:efflux RND transporter periplasmic adaptor subunit n=1 Tax=unclassified Janthinobacterium TaxID=2610881 RepID=UPI0018CA9C30|nr:efflux RND transporter periplasmic adaptor subunit [Janthinobacterium sp. CG_23.4]MDH6158260.1 multidrug efflux pump subunit AcrA (membrane-fusion protein) [Janthinobacterium sp. CG_23.4]